MPKWILFIGIIDIRNRILYFIVYCNLGNLISSFSINCISKLWVILIKMDLFFKKSFTNQIYISKFWWKPWDFDWRALLHFHSKLFEWVLNQILLDRADFFEWKINLRRCEVKIRLILGCNVFICFLNTIFLQKKIYNVSFLFNIMRDQFKIYT